MTHLQIPVHAITRGTLARTHELKMIVYVSIDSVSGTIFKILFQIQPENFFLTTSNHQQAKFCLFLGIKFVGAAPSFTAKISSFETVAKREAILNPVPKQ